MSSKLLHAFLLLILVLAPPFSKAADSSPLECPYPCLPPPTSVTNCPPPPSSPSGGYPYGSYPPPPPPPGYNPYFPSPYVNFPPPYVNFLAPPPPNPILPWFPWYYKASPSSAPPFKSIRSPVLLIAPLAMVLGLLLWW